LKELSNYVGATTFNQLYHFADGYKEGLAKHSYYPMVLVPVMLIDEMISLVP
jgi:hypothetical protein